MALCRETVSINAFACLLKKMLKRCFTTVPVFLLFFSFLREHSSFPVLFPFFVSLLRFTFFTASPPEFSWKSSVLIHRRFMDRPDKQGHQE